MTCLYRASGVRKVNNLYEAGLGFVLYAPIIDVALQSQGSGWGPRRPLLLCAACTVYHRVIIIIKHYIRVCLRAACIHHDMTALHAPTQHAGIVLLPGAVQSRFPE
jgi:hypothetical protein